MSTTRLADLRGGTGQGNTNDAIGRRPGQPTEMRSDVPSHVTSVKTTTTTAAIAIVRGRGILE
jgi:hypothetical protein